MEPSANVPIKDYVDKAIESAETRLTTQLDKLPSKGQMWGMVASILGGLFVFFVAVVGVLAWGGDRFDAGMGVSPAIAAAQQNQAEIDRNQNAMLKLQDQKLDIIIKQTAVE